MEATSYAQLLLKVKTGNNKNETNTLPSPSVQIKLHLVKITFPTKGQQIPVHSNLTVTGISVVNRTSTDCQVAVILNGIKPYQKAVPTGHGAANDYSTWNYRLTPTYTVIKQGQNKITAKLSCDKSNIISHNSVNITGVTNSNPPVIAASLRHVSSPNSKLLIALDLSKNPISAGGKETLKATVYNAANSTLTIVGARVNVTITDPSNRTVSNFNGTTNNLGIFTYTWKVSKDSKPGVFTVGVHASANEYQNQLTPTRTTFNVVSLLHKSDTSSTSQTHHAHKSSSDIYSQSPLSIIRIPHITFPQIHFPKIPSFY
ncbi:MAG: hypothetical protein WBZ36_19410 [Candidatus Nitrosopolaris sp.]